MSEAKVTINMVTTSTLVTPEMAAAAYLARLVSEHNSGMHVYGSMRRDCPLCNR